MSGDQTGISIAGQQRTLSLSCIPFQVMKLGGCQVVLKCDGKAIREFNPGTSEDGKETFCYIASQPGKVSAV